MHTLACSKDWWERKLARVGILDAVACHCTYYQQHTVTMPFEERLGFERAGFRNRRAVLRMKYALKHDGELPYAYQGWREASGSWCQEFVCQ